MTRATQILRLCVVLGSGTLAAGCSFHGEWRAGSSAGKPAQTSGAEARPAPSGGRREGVRVTVAPNPNHGSSSAPAPAPTTHQGSGAATRPLAIPPPAPAPTTHQGSGSATAPLAIPPPAPTHQGSGSATAPLAVPPPAAQGSGSATAPLQVPPAAEKPEGDRVSPAPGASDRPNVAARPDTRPSCRPFTLTARNGDALRLRVVSIPETAEARLDGRVLSVASRAGQVWTIEIPSDAKSGTLTLVDGASTFRCGRLATSAK